MKGISLSFPQPSEVNENNTIDLTECTPSPSHSNIGGMIPNIIALLRSLEDDTDNRQKKTKRLMKVCVNSALTALKRNKKNTTCSSNNNMKLTTMDSNSSTTTGNTSNDDTSTSNAKNLDSLSEGGKKPPANNNLLESPRKKLETEMDSDLNDSGSLL